MRKTVSLKVVFILLLVVAVIGLAAYAAKSMEARRIAHEADETLMRQTEQMADNLAQSIALFGSSVIADGNWGQVQSYADELVRANNIRYIAVVDDTGSAVVHTDRSLLGQRISEAEDEDDSITSRATVIHLNRRIAIVYVGIKSPE